MEVDKRQLARAKRQALKVNDYKTCFSTPAGRRVLYDLMMNCHFQSSTMAKDAHDVIFREGERNVVLRILTQMNTSIEKIKTLIEENVENAEKNNL